MREKHRRFLHERDRLEHERIRLLMSSILRPDDNCVDVGASSGDVLREIVRRAPRGRHIAYEPVPSASAALAAEFPTVQVRRSAVADFTGSAPFYHVVDEPPLSSLRPLPYHAGHHVERIRVDVEDLDGSLPDGFVPRLIKIDAEGAELQILTGAMGTITRHRPVVVFEYIRDGSAPFNSTAAQVFDLLTRRAGLLLFDVFDGGPYDLQTLTRTVHARRLQNFVAYPPGLGDPAATSGSAPPGKRPCGVFSQ